MHSMLSLFKIFLFIVGVAVGSATIHKEDNIKIEKLKERITNIKLKHPEEKIPGVCQVCEEIMDIVLGAIDVTTSETDAILHEIEDACNSFGFLSFVCKPIIDPILDAIIWLLEQHIPVTPKSVCEYIHAC